MAETLGLRGTRAARAAALLICGSLMSFAAPALGEEYRLAADTKIQVAIVQWNPTKGEYQKWDALGGTFLVSPDGTVGLPVIGSLQISDKTSTQAAAQIAAQLKDKLGLLSPPNVTVEIAQYPPIYVVGAVTTPGAYPFRPGLTVLQALAIAGGRYRAVSDKVGQNTISLRGELVTIRTDTLRLLGRIARLRAELAGDAEISFPVELTADRNQDLARQIMNLENGLFAARANEDKRQLTNLAELRDMYNSEIEMLKAKSDDRGKEITQTEKEVAGLTKLVEQGITTVSRWSELRRILSQMRAEHSEDDINAMKARQGLSDTTRKEFSIRDQRMSEVAAQLRDAEGELARLNAREDTVRKLTLDVNDGSLVRTADGAEMTYAIVRQAQSGGTEITAAESTRLIPGDVLKVKVEAVTPIGPSLPAAADAGDDESSSLTKTQ